MLAFNTHVYDTLKFVHILAAITWIGSGIFVQTRGDQAPEGDDQMRLAAFAKDIAFWGTRLFMPASLIVLLMGSRSCCTATSGSPTRGSGWD